MKILGAAMNSGQAGEVPITMNKNQAALARDYLKPKLLAHKAANPGVKAQAKAALSRLFGTKKGGGDTELAIQMLDSLASTGSYSDDVFNFTMIVDKINAVDPQAL